MKFEHWIILLVVCLIIALSSLIFTNINVKNIEQNNEIKVFSDNVEIIEIGNGWYQFCAKYPSFDKDIGLTLKKFAEKYNYTIEEIKPYASKCALGVFVKFKKK